MITPTIGRVVWVVRPRDTTDIQQPEVGLVAYVWNDHMINVAHNTTSGKGRNPDGRKGPGGSWLHGNRDHPSRKHSSGSKARKFASASIAKIPLPLARHIGQVYKPTSFA